MAFDRIAIQRHGRNVLVWSVNEWTLASFRIMKTARITTMTATAAVDRRENERSNQTSNMIIGQCDDECRLPFTTYDIRWASARPVNIDKKPYSAAETSTFVWNQHSAFAKYVSADGRPPPPHAFECLWVVGSLLASAPIQYPIHLPHKAVQQYGISHAVLSIYFRSAKSWK